MVSEKRPPPWIWEVAAALILLAWRIFWHPLPGLWNDWIVLLSLYWIFTACARRSRAWLAVTLLTMTILFLIYAARQVPMTLDLLRSVL